MYGYLKDRNLTSHTYNEETAQAIAEQIMTPYFKLFEALHSMMQAIADLWSGDE